MATPGERERAAGSRRLGSEAEKDRGSEGDGEGWLFCFFGSLVLRESESGGEPMIRVPNEVPNSGAYLRFPSWIFTSGR